ncbi:MAG: hypothetical protein M3247_06540 [Thermoproteota archaeon]|nr:hypothetical protein [Thermoproteota archaeon]
MVFRRIYNSLDDKMIFLMQDILASTPLKDNIAHPLRWFLYTISCLHCVSYLKTVQVVEAIWGKENGREMLNDVGFKNDFQNYYYIAYKNK